MARFEFRTQHAREVVYDPDNPTQVLAESSDYKIETDDAEVAKKLEHMNTIGLGVFVPWAEVGPDDVFVLKDGSEVRVRDLPEEVVRTLLTTPKRIIKKASEIKDKLTSSNQESEPPEKFVCDYPDCGKEFPSQAALNGHKASHAKRED